MFTLIPLLNYTLLKYAFYVQNNSPLHFTSRVKEEFFFFLFSTCLLQGGLLWLSVAIESFRRFWSMKVKRCQADKKNRINSL